ncbi:MAG: alpha/beta fold hydrolase [Acidimicrobiia bacterium]
MKSEGPQSSAEPHFGKSETASRDWKGLGDLIDLATQRLTAPVEGIHDAIADRWFGVAGRRAVPARNAYRAVTAPVYHSVRLTGSALGTAVGRGAIAVASRKELRPLWRSPRGSGIQAFFNALWGDELERRGSPMSIEFGLRDSGGAPVGLDADSLALAFAEPSSRLVALVHGLGETERCWQSQNSEEGSAHGLADLLISDSFSPLPVRYNTGRHVSDNGVELAALLSEVTDNWPVPVEEIALVGHSMGGLVARSAVQVGQESGQDWVSAVRHVVALASPHLGSPVEKGANIAAWGLGLVSESRPLGEFINDRSVGIKDLRYGTVSEEDWLGFDPDELLNDVVVEPPPPKGVDQHFIAGVITTEPTHPIGALLGDLIVRVGSGTGRGRRRRVDASDVQVVGGKRHPDLLHDPGVHERIRAWLTSDEDYLPSK